MPNIELLDPAVSGTILFPVPGPDSQDCQTDHGPLGGDPQQGPGRQGGPAGERYLALQVVEDSPGLGPRYRCGVRCSRVIVR